MNELSTMPVPETSREAATLAAKPVDANVEAFTFGAPEGVLDRRDVLQYFESWSNGRWYVPPVNMDGLARAFDLPGPHSSCIRLKVNLLAKHFIPHRLLSAADFRKWALDYISLGNAYLERRNSVTGKALQLKHSLGRFTRRGVKDGAYFFVSDYRAEHEFKEGSVHHLLVEHPAQEIYGLPEFIGALQSALLGEAATIFRRRYFLNGSHAGYVFYLNETLGEDDVAGIRKALKDSKGPGNFRNLFIHAPGGKPEGVKILPISEVAAKDDFANIKSISRDDVLAAHRVPPQLVGIVPTNNAGFGDISKAVRAFYELEIEPLIERFLELNQWIGEEAVRFKPYQGIGAEDLPAS